MPSVSDVKKKKPFKKVLYRPWDDKGEKKDELTEMPSSQKNDEKILKVSTDKIIRWKYKNRPENELIGIDALADKIKIQGQQEACVVRKHHEGDGFFELITGERRWRATTKLGIPLKVVVKNLSDLEASIAQKEENDKEPVSDYANGICYANQIKDGVITQSNLTNDLGLSKQQVSRLLSYSKIPKMIISAIDDMTKVSSGTAEKIKQLSSKGEQYVDAIISIAAKIRTGKIGHQRLEKMINEIIKGKNTKPQEAKKIYANTGRHIFTWKENAKNIPSIHFSNDVLNYFKNEKLDATILINSVREAIENELDKISKK